MINLLEHTVQTAAIDWLKEQGYDHREGNSLDRDLKKVVLDDALKNHLHRSYPDVPQTALNEAFHSFTQHQGMDVHYRNWDFHKKLTQGIDISWKDGDGKEYAKHVYPIDYQNPENNSFICSDEVTVIGKNKRRADLVIFINGLPLVLFEFKNLYNKDTGVEDAHRQITHYIHDIPHLFDYNAISIVSDGLQAFHGMFSSSLEWFAPWKSTDGQEVKNERSLQLKLLIDGLFKKEVLLSYIQNHIFHEDHNGKIIKKGAKYHQYWGVTRAAQRAKESIRPLGDGRIGVIWHTQGSGKSISMAILTGILRQMPEMKNPTILIQVDRNDLDQQLYENFVLAKDLVGDVDHADDTEGLRQLLSSDGGGVIFTTIEKFRLREEGDGKEKVHPILSERTNIIVMADEAHRTQYGFKSGGFAQNLRRALPNASFIGFTGTPVDSKDADTEQVFGETIHTYDIKQAVKDGATVPIHYEPKMVPLSIKDEELDEVVEVTEADEASQNVVWAAIEDAAGADERVQKVASDILEHYHARTATLEGKAMIVCMSRRNCVKLYDALMALEGCPEVAVVMTSNPGKDPESWNPHMRTKDAMESIKKRFRNPDDPLKMVIVRDMWLTGFDAPCAHTMYVDKIMKGHNLMQAIARVNRVFRDKPNGLVVDFIGISDFLASATKKYTSGGGEGTPTLDIDTAVIECIKQLEVVKKMMGDFSIQQLEAMSSGDQMMWTNMVVNNLLENDQVTDDFLKEERKLSELVAITNSDERIWDIQDDVAVIQKIREAIRKIKFPSERRGADRERIKDLISKALKAHNVVDLAEMYDLDKIDISIIDEGFQATVEDPKNSNTKVELLRRILNDEISVRSHKNIQRMRKLKEELEEVLKRYHNHSLESIAAIKKLLEIAEELKQDDIRTKELGLTEDELAFYDLLSDKKELLNVDGPIQDLVHKVVASVKKNLQLDWTKKGDAKAAIRLAVKKELRGRVPFDELDNLLKELIEQAEGQYGEWPLVG